MTDHDTKQDREAPGAEWIEVLTMASQKDGSYGGTFHHIGLNMRVDWVEPNPVQMLRRGSAIERCRAISAAALHWERRKAEATGVADMSVHLAELANAWGKKL